MDIIANNSETNILEAGEIAMNAMIPLLERNRKDIDTIRRTTYNYGSLRRQDLDVYYPPHPHNGLARPLLFFVHGGGFIMGSRILPPPNDLVYTSLGAFFARKGFVTVIPNYRLVPEVQYPEGAHDIYDAINWIIQNQKLIDSEDANPDVNTIFLMGHSVGAAHVFTVVMHPEMAPTDHVALLPRIRGLIFSGGSFCEDETELAGPLSPGLRGIIAYYGSMDSLRENQPLALLRNASSGVDRTLPDILLVEAEKEPHVISAGTSLFKTALEERSGKSIERIVGKGHNHISPNVCLGSGEGEEWAEAVSQWAWSRVPGAQAKRDRTLK